jgi:trk system potassium uptake protein TrkA
MWSDETVHIIVVGCGRVGSELAMELSDEGHSVVVVDKNRDNLRRLTHFHGRTIVGSGHDRRRPGGRDERGQHEHSLRAYRA